MADIRDDIEALRETMQKRSILRGDFTLSSGAPSSYYYNGKQVIWDPREAKVIGSILLSAVLQSGAEAVGGLELGAVPIAAAIGRAALDEGRDLPTFTVRNEKKTHGTRERIAASYEHDGDLIRPGRRVAIVDDVITHGGSIKEAIDAVVDEGCEVVLVLALVARHEDGYSKLSREGYPVSRLFYTDENGNLFSDEDFASKAAGVTPPVGAPA